METLLVSDEPEGDIIFDSILVSGVEKVVDLKCALFDGVDNGDEELVKAVLQTQKLDVNCLKVFFFFFPPFFFFLFSSF